MLFGVADTCFTSLQGQARLVQIMKERGTVMSLVLNALAGQISLAGHVNLQTLEQRWRGVGFRICWMSGLLTKSYA